MSRMLRRGVLMTASSRRSRPAWLEEEDDQEEPGADGEHGGEGQRKASNEEWRDIEREVREEKRRLFAQKEFKSGRRGTVVAYDDVAGDEEADEQPPGRGRSESSDAEDGAPEASPSGAGEGAAPACSSEAPAAPPAPAEGGGEEGPLPPEGAVTAGQQQRERKRGGQKKTGAQKRREAEERAEGKEGEEGGPRQKRSKNDDKEAEDPDRWIKLRLQGEKKPKRIDATRVVVYHDFDCNGARSHQEAFATITMKAAEPPEAPRQGGDEVGPVSRPEPPKGNFRAQVRRDLWDDDSDDE